MARFPKIILKEGDILEVDEFCFTNPQGGTGLSNWDYNEKFQGTAQIKITKLWFDEETGIKGWAEPISEDIKDYMKCNAKQEDDIKNHDLWNEDEYKFKPEVIHIPANTVFWSEHNIIEKL